MLVDDVMPLINKLGCNNAACHAAARGQGNLRLSMFGDDPAADYDAIVRELLTASGSNFRRGEVNFFRANQPAAGTNPAPAKPIIRAPQTLAETTALLFMGVRMGCARCHGHPTEHWSLEDNLGLAAFFARVAMKPTKEWKEEIVYVNRKGYSSHPKTDEVVKPKYLDGDAVEVGAQRRLCEGQGVGLQENSPARGFGRRIDGRKMFRGGTRFLFILLPSIFRPQFFGGTEAGQTTAIAAGRFSSAQARG